MNRWLWLLALVLVPALVLAAGDRQTKNPLPAANTSFLSDLQTILQEEDAERFADIWNGFVVSGGTHGAVAGLTGTPAALTAYAGGFLVTETGAITYVDNTTCWAIAHRDRTGDLATFSRVAGTHYLIDCSSGSQPALPANSTWLMEVTTSAGAISAVSDLRLLDPVIRPSSTKADLPAGNDEYIGREARVTDDVRGVWTDFGRTPGWGQRGANVLDVRDFGCALDDTTDDAACIQDAIDEAGSTANQSRSGIVVEVPGPAAIGSTLLIDGKSITLRCRNWGRTDDTKDNRSYLRWIGAAGSAMVRLQDTRGGARIEDCRFVGNTTNVPNSAISLNETADGVPNSWNILENISVGFQTGEAGFGTDSFVHGITIEGTNNNNAEMSFRNIRVQQCSGDGIHVGGTQNLVLYFETLVVQECTNGISNAGEVTGTNWFFANNDVDIFSPLTDDNGNAVGSVTDVRYFASESSGRLAEFLGQSRLYLDGGYWQLSTSTHSDGRVIKSTNNSSQAIEIRNFEFTQASAPPTAPFLEIKSAPAGASGKHIVLDNIKSFSNLTGGTDGLDAATTAASTDRRYVYFRENAMNASANIPKVAQNFIIGGSAQWDRDRFDIPRQGIPRQDVVIDAATTFAVTSDFILLDCTGAETINTITGGKTGEIIRILHRDTECTLADDDDPTADDAINLRGTATNDVGAPDKLISLFFAGSHWLQVSESVN